MNKLIAVMGIGLVLLIGMFIFSSDDNEPATNEQATATAPAVDNTTVTTEERDDYVNTLKTISARSIEQDKTLIELKKQLEEQRKETVTKKDVEDIANKTAEDRAADFTTTFNDKIDWITKSLGAKNRKPGASGDIPAGLGLDELIGLNPNTLTPGEDVATTSHDGAMYMGDDDQLVTIKPMTTISMTASANGQPGVMVMPDGRPVELDQNNLPMGGAPSVGPGATTPAAAIPMYTIPQNATLFHNSGMTALVGVVPNNEGAVLDPIRFKLITGPQNIATNGLYLPPGVKDIVWSGIAIGNREMSCTRGELHSVTFTFEDGTIQTINSQGDSGRDRLGGAYLGYIATQRGNPCVPGQLITNAQQYLNDRMWASGFASAADAFAQTQQTTTVTPDGGVIESFNGDTANFIAGQTLTGSLQELVQYLRDRQASAIDLVFVASGQDLVIHVEKEIAIDYNPNGRKLSHANQIPQSASTAALD